jgi:2-dehydropantoate 2-reductase
MNTRKIESALIAGAGSIGLTVAGALYEYDPECVSVLAGGERLARYRRDGLWVNGKRLAFTLADVDAPPAEPAGLIIAASKYHHLGQILKDIKRYVGEETLIVSLLNGISSEDIIGKVYGRQRLPLAMIIGTDARHTEGRTVFSRRGVIHFGDAGGLQTQRDLLIADFLRRAGIPFEYHPRDMQRTLWYKFMVNVGINQVSALLRLPYGPFKRGSPPGVQEARELLEAAMREVIAVARAGGIHLGDEDIESWYKTVGELDDRSYTSMCQDVLAGRKTEVEMFAPVVGEYGRKHGIPTPVNDMLHLALRTIEKTYTAPV